MTPHAQRGLFVLALILASVSTASAEGAWVLWEGRSVSERGQVPAWRRVDAFNGEAECRTSALRQARSLYDSESRERNARARGLELRGTRVEVPIEFDWMTVSFECYSDTFDPRGPKGR